MAPKKLLPRGVKQAIILLSAFVLALLPTVRAQPIYSFTYKTTNGAITITGYSGSGGAVTIPNRINGLPVTSIGSSAFWHWFSLTEVTIPDSVTTIGDAAFWLCKNLTNVTMPSNLTTIGQIAFAGCVSLTRVTIPDSVTNMGWEVFNECSGLTAIKVGTLNSNYCSVDGVLLDKNQTTLIQYAGSAEASYVIPKSVTTIADGAFQMCSSPTNVTMPAGLTKIGDDAFAGCISLASISIPADVTNIGWEAFSSCSGLTAITVDPLNATYCSVDGVVFDKSRTTVIQCPGGKDGRYIVPNGVTTIGAAAFEGSTGLTNITIPTSVTNIGALAFSGCVSLTNITIPNSVTSIGGAAFASCTGLTSLSIPNSVTSLGYSAFQLCTSLTSVSIPDSLSRIEDWTFYSCSTLSSVTIPGSVTNIGDYAFNYCGSLRGVYFKGNAPGLGAMYVFNGDNNATVYYLPGTTGWSPTFGGLPTAPWVLPNPVILNGSIGMHATGFGFVISWATNVPVLVEATTKLTTPSWVPLATNTLTSGSSYFSDPQGTNYPSRFYRAIRGE